MQTASSAAANASSSSRVRFSVTAISKSFGPPASTLASGRPAWNPRAGLDAALGGQRLDALVAPTGGPAWKTDLVNGDHFVGSSSSPAAVSGYPALTVPAGFVHGLPVGLTLMGTAWSEARLLALAYDYEQATRHRQPPRFLPTLP